MLKLTRQRRIFTKMTERQRFQNIIILGGAFGLLYTGCSTIAATAETILRSYRARTGQRKLNLYNFGLLDKIHSRVKMKLKVT